MALPPERLEDLLPKATRVVIAEVLEEVDRGAELPRVVEDHPPDWVGPLDPDPWQLVRILVREVLMGPRHPEELIVYKPQNPYLLSAGDLRDADCVMLLREQRWSHHPHIMGRYGPKFYRRDQVARLLTDRS